MPSVKKTTLADGTIVLGLEDVRTKILDLPRRLGVNVVRRGLLAGAGVIRDEARLRVPQKPGRSKAGYQRTDSLKKAIKSESRGVFKDGSGKPVEHRAVVIIDKVKRKRNMASRYYAHFVEYGTRPHAVGKGSILEVFARSKAKKKQTGGTHPGTAPQPFMRPAFETKKLEAVRVIAETVRRETDKELAKLRTSPRKTG